MRPDGLALSGPRASRLVLLCRCRPALVSRPALLGLSGALAEAEEPVSDSERPRLSRLSVARHRRNAELDPLGRAPDRLSPPALQSRHEPRRALLDPRPAPARLG